MLRAFLAEWIARSGIQWVFTCRERQARWAARVSAWLFAGSHRGTLLSVYFSIQEGNTHQVLSRLRKYYAASLRRAAWGKRLDQWRREKASSNGLFRRVLPRFFSLAKTWLHPQPVPRQVQQALWKTGQYAELAGLAQASGQPILQAHALVMDGKSHAALEQLKQIPPGQWNGEAAYVNALSLQALGQVNEAAAALELAVAENGGGRTTRNLLIELYHQTGQEQKALDEAERLVQDYLIPSLQFRQAEDGRVYHLITEDHELTTTPGKSDGNPWLSLREARIQLIEKGRIVNRIAENCGTPWTHLIDIGSYTVLKSAAEQYPGTWGEVLAEFTAFLAETTTSGNDLGVHVHPDKSFLAVEKVEADHVWITRHTPGWGELTRFGKMEDPSSKLGLVFAGKKLVEQYARQVAPDFQAMFFRSGAFATGSTLFETSESLDALSRVGLWVGSDALAMDGITESLGRTKNVIYRAAFEAPWMETAENGMIQALPLQTRDFPVYSVVEAARRYAHDKQSLARLEQYAINKGCLTAFDHDIEINNTKMGGRWDDLNPSSGDWAALAGYLEGVGRSKAFRCIRANDLVKRMMEG